MTLVPGQLEAIAAAVDDPQALELVDRLRAQFAGLTFILCADDDVIGVGPVLEQPTFNLYLMDDSSHCMRLMRQPELASGVVVAWKDED